MGDWTSGSRFVTYLVICFCLPFMAGTLFRIAIAVDIAVEKCGF